MYTKFFFLLLPTLLLADQTGMNVDTTRDTTITIKKGVKPDTVLCTEYEIIDGSEDISGSPEFDKAKARLQWKEACKEWKDNLKELNKANSLINLSCGAPSAVNEEENKVTFKSKGSFKVKVKMKEKAKD